MPRMGFEPITPAFERAKTVYALDGAATMSGRILTISFRNFFPVNKMSMN
jgi:hypothetical protein